MSIRSHRRPERSQRPSRLSTQLEQLESRRLMSGDPASLRAAGFEPIEWQGRTTYARPDEWIVQIDGLAGARGKQLKAANALLAGTGISARDQLGADGLLLVRSAAGAAVDHLRNALQRVPGFRYFEPNAALSLEQTPNDADFEKLWGLHNANDADIDAPEAWDLSTGGASTVVGVIDTGVDYNHPDLKDNMWVNPGEVAGDKLDNDGNGYVDDIHGYDFVNNDADPMDDHGHGTHVAGTIGGVGNNGAGMTGVNWNAQIMGLKFLAADGYGTSADAIEALYYTMNLKNRSVNPVNVSVTNNSYGGEPWSRVFYDALKASGEAGQLFVAASGNGDWLGRAINNDTTPHYPSSYGHDDKTFIDPATGESLPSLDNVIAVTATDSNDARGSFGNYGVKSVDIGAPGVNIWSLSPGGGYNYNTGTSMAAPHVAGAVALAWSYNPSATAAEVKSAVLSGGDAISSMATTTSSGRRLNARGMLNALPVTTPPEAPALLTATALSSNQISLTWSNVARESGYRVQRWQAATSTEAGKWLQVGTTIADATTFTDTGLTAGTAYTYRIEAYNPAGVAHSPTATETTKQPALPEAPSGLTALATGATTIQLKWTDNSAGETGFQIERYDGSSTVIIPVAADVTGYTDSGLRSSTVYTYRVRATSTAGVSADSNTATVTTAGTGTGLRADYYDNMLAESSSDPNAYSLSGWKFARTDANINVNWGTGAPTGGTSKTRMAGDTFTVKWTGMVQPRYTDDYVFRFEPDDGVGMWITVDGVKKPLWTPTWDRYDADSRNKTSTEYANTSPHESVVPIALKAGVKYPIEIVYYEYSGGASAKLMWRSANYQAQEVIPTSQLYQGPTDLTATAISSTQVNLSWSDNSADEGGFKVERSTNGSTWTQIATVAATNTGSGSYVAGGLAAGTAYHFRVRAYNGSPAFNSAYSTTAVATTSTSATRTSAGGVFSTKAIEGDSLLDEVEVALT